MENAADLRGDAAGLPAGAAGFSLLRSSLAGRLLIAVAALALFWAGVLWAMA